MLQMQRDGLLHWLRRHVPQTPQAKESLETSCCLGICMTLLSKVEIIKISFCQLKSAEQVPISPNGLMVPSADLVRVQPPPPRVTYTQPTLRTNTAVQQPPNDQSNLYPWRRPRTLPRMPDFAPSSLSPSQVHQMQMQHPQQQFQMSDSHKQQPPNMPLAPPRRKKKLFFSGLKNTFKRMVGVEKSPPRNSVPYYQQPPEEHIYAKINPIQTPNGAVRRQSTVSVAPMSNNNSWNQMSYQPNVPSTEKEPVC